MVLPVPFETPGAPDRAERLAAVAAMIYLLFNEGYSASNREADARAPLAIEAIRLIRLLLRLFPAEPARWWHTRNAPTRWSDWPPDRRSRHASR